MTLYPSHEPNNSPLLDLEPTQMPAYIEEFKSAWSRAVSRWNTYRSLRRSGVKHWRALNQLAEQEQCTPENIQISINRVRGQLYLEHPELSAKGGDTTTS